RVALSTAGGLAFISLPIASRVPSPLPDELFEPLAMEWFEVPLRHACEVGLFAELAACMSFLVCVLLRGLACGVGLLGEQANRALAFHALTRFGEASLATFGHS